MSPLPNSSLIPPARPTHVRYLFLALWFNLAQAAAVVTIEPVSSDTRLGLQIPMLLMSMLLLIRMQQGLALARVGHSLVCLTYLTLNFAPAALSWRTGLSASITALVVGASWLPEVSLWYHSHAQWHKGLPADRHRRFARQGLLYGAAWVAVSGVSMVLTDWFNAPVSTEVLTFSAGCLSGWVLMGRYLALLLLQPSAAQRD